MENTSCKVCRENQNTFYIHHIVFGSRADYDIKLKNTVQPNKPQMATWRIRFACWVPKATNTQSEYVSFMPSPLQQWLHEHTSTLRYANITCLAYYKKHVQLNMT
jgi:hypothetical protein